MKILFCLFFLCILNDLKAQNCAMYHVTPLKDHFGYKGRAGDERCEGLLTERVAGQSLEILSFTKGTIRYYVSMDEELTITAPERNGDAEIRVTGMNFGMSDVYRLDMLLAPGKNKMIPASEVLQPKSISQDHFGIFGYVDSKEGRIYIPLSVASKRYEKKIDKPYRYFLKLVTNTDIPTAEWRCAVFENGNKGLYSAYQAFEGGNFRPNVPMVLELPSELEHKNIQLSIRYKSSGVWTTKYYTLSIP